MDYELLKKISQTVQGVVVENGDDAHTNYDHSDVEFALHQYLHRRAFGHHAAELGEYDISRSAQIDAEGVLEDAYKMFKKAQAKDPSYDWDSLVDNVAAQHDSSLRYSIADAKRAKDLLGD